MENTNGLYIWKEVSKKKKGFQLIQQSTDFDLISCKFYEAAECEDLSIFKKNQEEFSVEETRSVCIECNMKNLSTSAWENTFEFLCENQDRQVIDLKRKKVTILPHEDEFSVAVAFGEKKPGFWKEGSYTVKIKSSDVIIFEKKFRCSKEIIYPGSKPVPIVEPEPNVMSAQLSNSDYLKVNSLKPFPSEIEDKRAAILAYKEELDKIADYLSNGLSVLVACDKILIEYIYEYICERAGKMILMDKTYELSELFKQFEKAKEGSDLIMVLRSVEMLDRPSGHFVLYHTMEGQSAQFLAFKDAYTPVDKVLINRFAVHANLLGLPRRILENLGRDQDGRRGYITTRYLVTEKERNCFIDFDSNSLYKQVSSLNVIQFRQAMTYIGARFTKPKPSRELFREIRQFKVDMMGDEIEIPTTTFDDIGGYESVKHELRRMLRELAGPSNQIGEKVLVRSKGFIFHGEPGTGKTLFAKAIANEMHATIQMISGPEIINKWVGQSEANMRMVFAKARRNAPSVILFDEFDSIAHKRTQGDDGGARVGNSLMAQLLTELDGFREDDGILVIGTTNMLKLIDRALLRPSRLTAIEIGLPDYDTRRKVAHIHAHNLKVDKMIINTYEAASKFLEQGGVIDENVIPRQFLENLYRTNPNLKERIDIEKQVAGFQNDILAFFDFIAKIKVQSRSDATPTVIYQMEAKLQELAKKYNLELQNTEQVIQKNTDSPTYTQSDIIELFAIVKEANENQTYSAANYYSSILSLVAEFTEHFNNDEIRALFQEAYLDFKNQGLLITPRYLGKKIGLIRKRKQEQGV